MEIVDTHGMKRNVKYCKKVVHNIYDSINKKEIPFTFIEVMIIGDNSKLNWVQWYPFEQFVVMNPNLVMI